MIGQFRHSVECLAGDGFRRGGVTRCQQVGHLAGLDGQIHAVLGKPGRIVSEFLADS